VNTIIEQSGVANYKIKPRQDKDKCSRKAGTASRCKIGHGCEWLEEASGHMPGIAVWYRGAKMVCRLRAACSMLRSNQGVVSPKPDGFAANLSAQRTRPVICITTKSVRTEPIVIARPVMPLKKKAYENMTR
jgi:hypothetical protein